MVKHKDTGLDLQLYIYHKLHLAYLYNQWTNFHKLSCTEKPQMRVIHTYMGCTKATTNDSDIRSSVAIKALSCYDRCLLESTWTWVKGMTTMIGCTIVVSVSASCGRHDILT